MYSFRPPESNSTLKVKRKSVFDWRTWNNSQVHGFFYSPSETASHETHSLHFARSDSLQSLGSFLVSTYCKLRKYFLLLMFSAPLNDLKGLGGKTA